MIHLIIETKMRIIIDTPNCRHQSEEVFAEGYRIQTLRQAAHAYHHLYRGNLDRVKVKPFGDTRLDGRCGIIIRYFPPTQEEEGMYLTRLETPIHPIASRFKGEEVMISPRHLIPQHKSWDQKELKEKFPVVILYESKNNDMKCLSFIVERTYIDAVSTSINGQYPESQAIASLVEEMEHMNSCRDCCCPKRPRLVAPSDENEESTHPSLDLINQFKDELPSENSNGQGNLVFAVPFTTNGSLVPSAAANLNEINITKNIGRVVPEEAIMARIGLYFSQVTVADMSSLLPGSKITSSVTNLFTSW